MNERDVIKVVTGHPTSDGAGVRLTRVLGTPALDQLDPFLMLDEFHSDRRDDWLAGFPDHPHRGFETVSTARRGLRHDHRGPGRLVAERAVDDGRPRHHPLRDAPQRDGPSWGLPALGEPARRAQDDPPRYQDSAPPDPRDDARRAVRARVVSGAPARVRAVDRIAPRPALPRRPAPRRRDLLARRSAGHAALPYIFDGPLASVPARTPAHLAAGQLAVLAPGDRSALPRPPARFLLLAAAPSASPSPAAAPSS